ncbi:MAG: hypothetical protein QOE54_5473 [Streptosporangiaceae bacterium]|jgi:hypothetical protein|nr:hypothetical protein [Streptosporangiaceae bacterium]MDX6433107.1 hypothetical protein [Streptosporangiaceae bacterium]
MRRIADGLVTAGLALGSLTACGGGGGAPAVKPGAPGRGRQPGRHRHPAQSTFGSVTSFGKDVTRTAEQMRRIRVDVEKAA